MKKRTEKDGDDEFKQENTGATQFGHNLLSAAAYKVCVCACVCVCVPVCFSPGFAARAERALPRRSGRW